jgi:hypothetical protein
MQLKAPFIQLPVLFDAGKLLAEVEALGPSGWRDHPQKYPGNFALPLISVDGSSEGDGVAGPMRPTEYLERCPYLMQVLEKLGAVWGRSRLMKLGGHAEVTPHVDVNYYWRERVRVHVPLITTPDVRFICGDSEVNMQEGECWIFDTWRMHRVINGTGRERIHLVADTVGSEPFWNLVDKGRIPMQAGSQEDWHAQTFHGTAERAPRLDYETNNFPDVMTPWEVRETLQFILHETPPHERLEAIRTIALRFINHWHALWTQHGAEQAAWPLYREALNVFEQAIAAPAAPLVLINGMPFMGAVNGLLLWPALGDRRPGSYAKK